MAVNINDLATKIGKSGTMNPNRYAVNITPPIQANTFTKLLGDEISPRIQRISLPERALTTIQQRSSYRESINIPKGYGSFSDLSMSILLSSDMRERKLLMAWHDLIISPNKNFHPSYLDDIVGRITILTYGNGTIDENDASTAEQHTFYGCYPLTVGDVDLTYTSTDEAATIDTTFTYRYFTMKGGSVGEEISRRRSLGDVKINPTNSTARALPAASIPNEVLERNPRGFDSGSALSYDTEAFF